MAKKTAQSTASKKSQSSSNTAQPKKTQTNAKSKKETTKKQVAKKTAGAKQSTSKASDNYQISYNPADLSEIGKIKTTPIDEISSKMRKAREAQSQWARLGFRERAHYIQKMRKYIVEHAEELADIVSKENGKSRVDALATEVIPCALAANWYAKNAANALAPQKLGSSSILFMNKRSQLVRLPVGVVGIISPWNYPLSIPFGEVVMGLMAGNAVMLKVAAATVMVGDAIEKIVRSSGLPEDLFQHIVGSGSQVSEAFFENGIDKIFFTGSVPTGKLLMRQASDTLTPLSLELGGKDPMVVLDDADLERATNGAVWAGYQNAGQSCGGIERIYVHESVYDQFVDLLAEKTRKLSHGPDENHTVDMGSMTTEEQRKIVNDHVQKAVKSGAKVVAQSKAMQDAPGYFYPATLVTGVNHKMPLMQEETFGPVLPVMKFSNVAEAIELANDSTMALTSSVWTKDTEKGKEIAKALHSGVTTINDHLYTHGLSEAPWGGWKESGLGRTHGALGLEEMTNAKVINWDLISAQRNIWWHPFTKETYSALLAALRFVFPRSPVEWVKSAYRLSHYGVKKMFTPWK